MTKSEQRNTAVQGNRMSRGKPPKRGKREPAELTDTELETVAGGVSRYIGETEKNLPPR
jgi:hypothetical protein